MKLNEEKNKSRRKEVVIAVLVAFLFFLYYSFWIFKLYPTLINDEYSALEYVYRVVKAGQVFPTPHRFHKPYSLILGFLAFAGGALAYELVCAGFSAGLVFVFFLCARRRLSYRWALLASIMLGFAPDHFTNTLRAITMIPAGFFIFLAIYRGFELPDNPERWKKYSATAFLGGLARPEAWLLAFPLAGWLFPKNKKQILRWLLSGALIALSALIWFGKDLYLNHNFFHSFEVAKYDKIIGTGAYFGPFKSLYFFYHFLSRRFSKIFLPFSVLGFFLYGFSLRKKCLKDLIFVMTLLFFFFFYFSTLSGVYPQMRFYYLLANCLIFFSAYLLERIEQGFKTGSLKWVSRLGAFLLLGWYFFWTGYATKTNELGFLKRESKLQRETIKLAEFLKPFIDHKRHRLLISDRRDDELSWLLRDLPIQNYIHFRETHFCERFYGRDYPYLARVGVEFRRNLEEICQGRKNFLDFQPEWIIWLDNDFQYQGVEQMYQWLQWQDRTKLYGYLIELIAQIGEYRVFQVKKLNQ